MITPEEKALILTTEYFVLVIFLVSTILIGRPLKASDLKGKRSLFTSLLFYLFSNIFTVAEEWAYPDLLNDAEHLCIFLGSLFMLIGLFRSFGKGGRSE